MAPNNPRLVKEIRFESIPEAERLVIQKQKPTIYDIAQLSDASASTVSAALNGTWKARRISEKTANKIQSLARKHGYTANLQARGLRKAKSGLVGMILPVHDNRFFSSMSQSFEAHARDRGWCPVIASTLRDPDEEIRTVETLASYAVDSLFIAGASDPAAISEICIAANIPHVYIDLPGARAPSVVSDNFFGAEALSQRILHTTQNHENPLRNLPYFVGGEASDFATSRRIEAFRKTVQAKFGSVDDSQVIACGYSPGQSFREVSALSDRLGGLPSALFINSLTAFEGALRYFVSLPPSAFENCTIGCYDYDPFGAFLQFPVHMVRQNADKLIATAYELVDAGTAEPVLIEIEPELIAPRTIYAGRFSELG